MFRPAQGGLAVPFERRRPLIIRLETERLLIEPFVAADAADLFAWSSDPDTTQYMGWKRHETLADTVAVLGYFERVKESQPPKFDRPLAFRDKASGRPLGGGGIHQAGEGAVELGWILRPEARRQGFAHEAAAALHAFAMTQLPWARRIEVRAHPDNATSIRLAQKLGYRPMEDCFFNMPQLHGAKTRLLRFGLEKAPDGDAGGA